jgi:hypothetical protein
MYFVEQRNYHSVRAGEGEKGHNSPINLSINSPINLTHSINLSICLPVTIYLYACFTKRHRMSDHTQRSVERVVRQQTACTHLTLSFGVGALSGSSDCQQSNELGVECRISGQQVPLATHSRTRGRRTVPRVAGVFHRNTAAYSASDSASTSCSTLPGAHILSFLVLFTEVVVGMTHGVYVASQAPVVEFVICVST